MHPNTFKAVFEKRKERKKKRQHECISSAWLWHECISSAWLWHECISSAWLWHESSNSFHLGKLKDCHGRKPTVKMFSFYLIIPAHHVHAKSHKSYRRCEHIHFIHMHTHMCTYIHTHIHTYIAVCFSTNGKQRQLNYFSIYYNSILFKKFNFYTYMINRLKKRASLVTVSHF